MKRGRIYNFLALSVYMIFLQTYFPADWRKELMRAYAFLLQKSLNGEDTTDPEGRPFRTKINFYAIKYVLGLYDWDFEKNQMVEPFPTWIAGPSDSYEEYEENLAKFKITVYPHIWFNFAVDVGEGRYEIISHPLEKLKEGFSKGKIAIFTHPEDWLNPYKEGVRIRLLDELSVERLSCNGKKMNYGQMLRFLFSADFVPRLLKGAQIIPPGSRYFWSATPQAEKIDFALNNSFKTSRTEGALWTLHQDQNDVRLNHQLVAIKKKIVTNGLDCFSDFLMKYHRENSNSDATKLLWTPFYLKMLEIGMLKTESFSPISYMLNAKRPLYIEHDDLENAKKAKLEAFMKGDFEDLLVAGSSVDIIFEKNDLL